SPGVGPPAGGGERRGPVAPPGEGAARDGLDDQDGGATARRRQEMVAQPGTRLRRQLVRQERGEDGAAATGRHLGTRDVPALGRAAQTERAPVPTRLIDGPA